MNIPGPKEEITLIKKNGDKVEKIQAAIQRGKIYIGGSSLIIERGDKFLRILPNGMEETHLIEDYDFYSEMGGHYEITVRKEGAPAPAKTNNIYNITGPNTRFNIASQDNSTNVINVNTPELFREIRKAFSETISGRELDIISGKIEELEKAQGTKTFLGKYQEFIAIAANHMTLIAPFLPALTQMLKL